MQSTKTKETMKILATIAISAALLTGCATKQPVRMTPQFAGQMASVGVHYGTRNISTNTRSELVFLSGVLCATAGGTNLSPMAFYQSFNPSTYSEVTLGILNGVQLIYSGIAAIADTNTYALADYAREIWCVGLPLGLGTTVSPQAARIRSQPLRPAVPADPFVDPKYPLWSK